jgi:hypothetical protein
MSTWHVEINPVLLTKYDSQKAWTSSTKVIEEVIADELTIESGCLVFSSQGRIVIAFAKNAWRNVVAGD